ncbi:MAG: NHL repeat-containing protein [Anaerolineae bacterium]
MLRTKPLIVMTLLVVCVLLVSIVQVLAYTPLTVYGQADFSSGASNRGSTTAGADTLFTPLGIARDANGGIYVADRDNHRVLYFAPDGDTTADRVYGQYGDFTAHISNNNGAGNSGAPSADSLSMPTAVALDSAGGLYVTDRDNHRVLYFAADGDTTADRVYGQYGKFTTNMTNNDGTANYGEPSADNFGTYILGIEVDSQDGLYVSDSSNHRVLYFAADGNTTADRVYGQFGDFTLGVQNNDGGGKRNVVSANSLNFPRGLATTADGGLYIADRDNNRILYYAPDGDTTADKVYGQFGRFDANVDRNDGTGNVGAPSADNLSHPKSIAVGPQGGLYVADTLNHRVLYFKNDGDTTADGGAGQFKNFASSVANNDGSGNSGSPSIDNLNGPQGITVDTDGLIYLSDTGNHRVMVIECPQWPG